jgi:hypothetical protein
MVIRTNNPSYLRGGDSRISVDAILGEVRKTMFQKQNASKGAVDMPQLVKSK